ncbi:RHS repeat-associated core domain-containing protein [Pseudomonas sp. NyZ480]|uniref:RHS repeat-associated core domain-containing protein n=1 Tax=Pseudomonas sp. NyZ480 TaxID=3035289 RepID=UPI002408F59E|nr:RHS repeat-associated core domain-containing protein [Pseudomonas sp. NyZ480]WEZ86383.1 RHS repeat-associated core domain-containing protein [Pseudomonas sp. NyZ480]
MKKHCFYQGGRLSAIGSIGQISVIFRSDSSPLAEQRAGALDKTLLLSTSATNSIMHAARAVVYAPYGHFDVLKHGAILAFNGQVRDSMTACDLLGNGKRLYSSTLMRFLSPDTYSPFGLGGINTYAYCGDDPINFTDPSGNIKYRIMSERENSKRLRDLARRQNSRTLREIAERQNSRTVWEIAERQNSRTPRQIAVVNPMHNGAPVQRQEQTRAVQQSGASTIGNLNRLMEGFTPGERQMTDSILAYALANHKFGKPPTELSKAIVPIFIARQLSLENGSVTPVTRERLLRVFTNATPEGRERSASMFEQLAQTSIAAYRARANL